MDSRIRWLRISYWTGALLDAWTCIILLDSDLWAQSFGIHNFHADWAFRYAQAFGCAMVAGWTVLLVWADRKPLERRGVLAITVFPVLAGLIAARYLLYSGGLVPAAFTPRGMAITGALFALFLFSYLYSFGKPKPAA